MPELSILYAVIGFFLAAYSVIANDSVQTLGTFIASNSRKFKWYWLWLAASAVLVATITYGWVVNDGDISYGRLAKIPYQEIQWYHAAAPAFLVLLTRFGIPVSTTFLVLSVFASAFVLEKMLVKSMMGYGIAAISAYTIWMVLSRFINEKSNAVKESHRTQWMVMQWCATGFLWFSWLSHDMANIAVFLPRQLPLSLLIGVIAVLVFGLALIFRNKGGKIQNIILEKTGSRFTRSATIIDLVYAFLLFFFKELNNIPMSTTWVFVGLLTGRELAIATVHRGTYKMKYVFPIIGKDFLKMMIGLAVSVALVLLVHYIIDPTE